MIKFNLTKMRFLFVLKPSDGVLVYVLCFLVIVQCSGLKEGGLETQLQASFVRRRDPEPSGSDAGLYNDGFYEGDIYKRWSRMKNAVADKTLLWPYAAIVYKTDDSVGCPDSVQCQILMTAFEHYHKKSCIRFKEWTGEQHYIRVFFNQDSGACWSPVGRTGDGEQKLSLGQRCWYLGIVIHELGHSLGFWHEMNRPDRDSYISIHWRNILPGFRQAFYKHDETTANTLEEEFDYSSIMMYDEFAFSKDGKSPTLQAKNNSVIGPIWKKSGLSASDVRRLHKLYSCDGLTHKAGFPYDIHCDFDLNTCGFKNGGKRLWSWRNINDTDGYVYTSAANSNDTGYFISVGLHAAEEGAHTRGPTGCIRFWYLMQGNGEMYLKLRQSYLERSTQLVYVAQDTFDLWESGAGTRDWTLVQLDVYVSKPFKLIFESGFEGSTDGVMALDNLSVSYEPCTDIHTITTVDS